MDYDLLKASDGTGPAVLAHITANRDIGSTVIVVDSLAKWNDKYIVTTGTMLPSGFLDPATVTEMRAHTVDGDIVIDSFEPGYTDQGNTSGQVAIVKQTTGFADAVAEALSVLTNAQNRTGMIQPYAGRTAPTSEWLMCFGQAISRTTYADLFNVLVPNLGTFTVTIAAPAVVTLASHGLETGEQVYLTTTSALPSGLSPNTLYYVIRVDANTFRLATSYANAIAGTAITTTGSQSGVHSLMYAPYGNGDGTTTFNVPDIRGRVIAGRDNMGGTSANRLTNPAAAGGGVNGDVLGYTGGSETHTLTTAQQANATGSQSWHGGENSTIIAGWAGIISTGEVYGGGYKAPPGTTGGANSARYGWTINLGFGGGAHNNVQPSLILNYIIKI